MRTRYYIINRSDRTEMQIENSTYDVSLYLAGRRLSNFIIVKSDNKGDRVIALSSPIDSVSLENELERG